MNTPVPSQVLVILATLLVGMIGASSRIDAGEKKLPKISAVLLRDLDLSREIPPAKGRPKAQTLRSRTVPGYDAMHSALWSGAGTTVSALLANGADPDAKSKDGAPILHYAVWNGQLEKLEDLLNAGANPNLPDKQGTLPLHSAIWGGRVKIVELLVKYGADTNGKNTSGTTALEYARQQGRKDVVAVVEAKSAKAIAMKRLALPTILRQPDLVFGSNKFRAAGGGQALVYSADGKQLVAGDEKGTLRFFDAMTGELRNVINAHARTVLGLAWIPKSPIVVSAGDGSVRFWNSETSQELMRLSSGSKALAVSPDGRLLYTGYHLWQIESTEPLKLVARGHEIKDPDPNIGSSWSFFTPDNRYLVIYRYGSGVWVWDLKKESIRKIDKLDATTAKAITWQHLASVCDIGTATPTDTLALLADQFTIVTGHSQTLEAFSMMIPFATASPRALASSPGGQFLAGMGSDSRIDVYDLADRGRPFKHDGHTAAVMAVGASPDGTMIASGGNDKIVRIWSIKTGAQLAKIPVASFVYAVRFSPDSKRLAIGDNNSNFYLWEVKERELHTHRGYGRITDLAFAKGGERLVLLGDELHLFDMKTLTTKTKVSAGVSGQGLLAVSPDGLIVGSVRSSFAGQTFSAPAAWTIAGDNLIEKKGLFSEAMGHRSFIDAVAFSQDGSLLAVSSASSIRLWDMKKRQPVGGKMCGHTTSLSSLTVSPDCKWLASGSWDGTARVWEVATGRQTLVLDADVDRISSVAFTPDGQLATANWDGTVHLWDLPKHLAPRNAK